MIHSVATSTHTAALEDPLATAAREDDVCVQLGYPQEIVEAFRKKNLSLWRLPEISSGTPGFRSDYIALKNEDLPINPATKTACACARIYNSRGRVGFALMLQGHAEGNLSIELQDKVHTGPINQFKFVMALHQRYSESKNHWVSSYSLYELCFGASYEAHKLEPPYLMGKDITPWLLKILDGKDPIFRLAGPIPQVVVPQPLPLPHIAPPQPEEEAEREAADEPNCCWALFQGVWNGLVALVEWLISWVR